MRGSWLHRRFRLDDVGMEFPHQIAFFRVRRAEVNFSSEHVLSKLGCLRPFWWIQAVRHWPGVSRLRNGRISRNQRNHRLSTCLTLVALMTPTKAINARHGWHRSIRGLQDATLNHCMAQSDRSYCAAVAPGVGRNSVAHEFLTHRIARLAHRSSTTTIGNTRINGALLAN